MERLNVLGGVPDRGEHLVVDVVDCTLGLAGHVDAAQFHVVELPGELPDGGVALLTNSIDDVADVVSHCVDARVALEQRVPIVGGEFRNLAYLHIHTVAWLPGS